MTLEEVLSLIGVDKNIETKVYVWIPVRVKRKKNRGC